MAEKPAASTKSVAQKLLVKPGMRVLLINAPEGAQQLFGGLPENAEFISEAGGPAGVVLLFAHNQAELERLLPEARAALGPNGVLWVAYHKGTSAVKTDINRDIIWRFVKPLGMDAVAMISMNDDWSAMRIKIV